MNKVWALISRGLSGVRQGLYYRGLKRLGNITVIVQVLTMWVWFANYLKKDQKGKWLVLISVVLYTMACVFVVWSFFYTGPLLSIHLWTYAESLLWSSIMALANYDLAEVAFWAYFMTILFSGLVQVIGFNQPFIKSVMPTDDSAGRWFGMRVFGTDIRIPRLSNGYIRLGILVILGIIWAVKSYYKWDWRLLHLLGIDIV